MRILITCTRLNVRAGTQMFVRDLARHLQGLGHSVFAFGSNRAHDDMFLEDDAIPVAANLESLPFKPDIIHAQHHLDAMTAISWLPGVPAVYHCNGAIWNECPPIHPRIHHYLAMSRTLALRMSVESGIPPSDITVFLNPVDLARFAVVRDLPARPARALFFNGRHEPGSDTVQAIREATARCGLALDFIGHPFAPVVAAPERILPSYDIVFASGRSAIEALAAGCAVVVLGRTSCGDLVLPWNYDHFRNANFSVPVNSPPPSVDRIEAGLRRYSAPDCTVVSRRLRSDADMALAVQRLLGIYSAVIQQHRDQPDDLAGEMRSLARYLQRIVPLIKITDAMLGQHWNSPTRAGSFEELRARIAMVERERHRPGQARANPQPA